MLNVPATFFRSEVHTLCSSSFLFLALKHPPVMGSTKNIESLFDFDKHTDSSPNVDF